MKAKTLIKGFCIELPGKGFDFHFASYAKEEDLQTYVYHHRLQFRNDTISAMKRCGLVPFPNMDMEEAIKLLESFRATKDINKALTKEAEELKSTDTTIVLYQRKYDEVNGKLE